MILLGKESFLVVKIFLPEGIMQKMFTRDNRRVNLWDRLHLSVKYYEIDCNTNENNVFCALGMTLLIFIIQSFSVLNISLLAISFTEKVYLRGTPMMWRHKLFRSYANLVSSLQAKFSALFAVVGNCFFASFCSSVWKMSKESRIRSHIRYTQIPL